MKYKLIKLYPGLPKWAKIGAIVLPNEPFDSYIPDEYTVPSGVDYEHIPKEEVENFPEFWEKEFVLVTDSVEDIASKISIWALGRKVPNRDLADIKKLEEFLKRALNEIYGKD